MDTTTTALSLIVPQEHWTKINEMRSKYDRAFYRWKPHINFLFPFVPQDKFPEIAEKLGEKLKGFKPFNLYFNDIGYFKNNKNYTFHLKPQDDSQLRLFFKIIQEALPNIENKKFNPHLTLGQSKKADFDSRLKELQVWLGNGLSFTVDRICLLNRSEMNPFSVNREIFLS